MIETNIYHGDTVLDTESSRYGVVVGGENDRLILEPISNRPDREQRRWIALRDRCKK